MFDVKDDKGIQNSLDQSNVLKAQHYFNVAWTRIGCLQCVIILMADNAGYQMHVVIQNDTCNMSMVI